MKRLSIRLSLLAAALFGGGALLAQTAQVQAGMQPGMEDEAPRRIRTAAEMPKVATSADRFVEVVAADIPGDPVGFRLPILQFTTRLVREVERVYKLSMPRGEPGLVIHALEGRTNDVRVIARPQRRDNVALTRVWLPSPGYSDLDQLRFSIVKAYFHAWIDRNRPKDAAVPAAPVPDWLVLGALRTLDGETMDADKHAVLDLWSTAAMPFFPRLCANLKAGPGDDAVFCGYIVSWMREKKIFRRTLEDFAAGQAFDGRRLAVDLTDETDPERQDKVSDDRLMRLTRSVLSPGRATPWDIKVFTSRLLLYPSEFDKNIGANGTSCTFREAIALAAENPAVREAAWKKAREIPFCAIGRGPALTEVSESYRKFLVALARGDGAEVLAPLLDVAEAQMQEILNEDRKDDNR